MILKVQDREIVNDKFLPPTTLQEDDKNFNPIEFNLIFEATRIHQQIEQKILLENKGVFAITYGWCSAETMSKSSVIIPPNEKDKIKAFRFNKNTDIILPGQIVTLSVWYNSHGYDQEMMKKK